MESMTTRVLALVAAIILAVVYGAPAHAQAPGGKRVSEVGKRVSEGESEEVRERERGSEGESEGVRERARE